jgi:acyl-CoA thioester hydrolase
MHLGREMPAVDTQIVVARTEVDYLAPILLRAEPYDCWTQIAHIGHTSVVLDSEICDGDTTLARARVVVVFFDPATQRPTAPPASYQERLRRLTAD